MANPEPKATPATVIEVADEGDVMILSDDPVNSLTVDDLPMGILTDANKQAATQIVEMFKEKAPGMPREVRDNILSLLKEGAFHHNKSSRTEPPYHPLVEKMWDKQVMGPWWHNITYENWFILVGIYGLEKLNATSVGVSIRVCMQRRYGGNTGTDLTWRNHPVGEVQHARHLLTQLATRFSKLQRAVDKLQKTIDQQQETIQKLVEEQQQGLTGHNQDDYDEQMEDWARYYEDEEDEEAEEDDDVMEKLARHYLGYGDE